MNNHILIVLKIPKNWWRKTWEVSILHWSSKTSTMDVLERTMERSFNDLRVLLWLIILRVLKRSNNIQYVIPKIPKITLNFLDNLTNSNSTKKERNKILKFTALQGGIFSKILFLENPYKKIVRDSPVSQGMIFSH